MKNKTEIISELIGNNFLPEKFPIDVLYTEIAYTPNNDIVKNIEKKPELLNLNISMDKYPWIGQSIRIPMKPISKLLNPDKILPT